MTRIADQYRIITSRAGWIDRETRGRLKFEGADALTFLQGLLTNDVSHLQRGHGVYAAWLTALGRMTADIVVLHRGGHLVGLVGDGLGAALAARFDSMIFAEQLTVMDASADLADLLVTGTAAAEVTAEATGAAVAALASLEELSQIDMPDVPGGFVVRVGESSFPAFRIVVPQANKARIVAAIEAAGAAAMTEPMTTALRIEAGRGEWGHDLSEDVIPLEAGLIDRAISTSKGCYVGQEIVIRILHRGGGRVAKRLVVLACDASLREAPAAPVALEHEGSVVGHLTSAAFSPARECVIALGYLQRAAAEIGQRVTIAGTGATAVVTDFAR